jgi:hypothetical protein
MLGILRKDYGIFALATLVVFPGVLLIESVAATNLRPAWVTTNMVLTWLLVFVPLSITEMEEEHANGYLLMGSLPVRVWEIVAAKFLLFLAAITTCTVAQFVFLAVVQPAPSLLTLAYSVVLLTGAAGLLLGGAFYAAIFSFGCARFITASLFVCTASTVVAPILLSKPAARELLRKAAGALLRLNGVEVILGGLAVYALLSVVAVTLFRFEPKKRYRPLA